MSVPRRLWVVGQIWKDAEDPKDIAWHLVGVFDSEAKAIDACRVAHRDVIIPVLLNGRAPEESVEGLGIIYPLSDRDKSRVGEMVDLSEYWIIE